jgi:hypothetical protein
MLIRNIHISVNSINRPSSACNNNVDSIGYLDITLYKYYQHYYIIIIIVIIFILHHHIIIIIVVVVIIIILVIIVILIFIIHHHQHHHHRHFHHQDSFLIQLVTFHKILFVTNKLYLTLCELCPRLKQ